MTWVLPTADGDVTAYVETAIMARKGWREVVAGPFVFEPDGVVNGNMRSQPDYAPYCNRCPGLKRMRRVSHLRATCGVCGATHKVPQLANYRLRKGWVRESPEVCRCIDPAASNKEAQAIADKASK